MRKDSRTAPGDLSLSHTHAYTNECTHAAETHIHQSLEVQTHAHVTLEAGGYLKWGEFERNKKIWGLRKNNSHIISHGCGRESRAAWTHLSSLRHLSSELFVSQAISRACVVKFAPKQRGIFQPYAHCLKHATSPYEGGLCMHFTVCLNFELQSICYFRNWKFGSPSVTASTEKQGWKKKRGRTGEKEIKGWINSPTAASCSSPFWNICQRRKDRSREREQVRKNLQKR